MLTLRQVETLAYDLEGEALCHACARKEYSALVLERVEQGLDDRLRPLSRYQLDEDAIERGWDEAEARVDGFRRDHPAIRLEDGQWRGIVALVAARVGRERCVECGAVLTAQKPAPTMVTAVSV